MYIIDNALMIRGYWCSQSLQDEMMDLIDVSSEIQETLGRSYNLHDIDEDELLGGKIYFEFLC